MLQSVVQVLIFCLAIRVAWLLFRWKERIRSVNNSPGFRPIYTHASLLARLEPIFIPSMRVNHWLPWKYKFDLYKKLGTLGYTSVSMVSNAPVIIGVADSQLAQEILSNRPKWPKPWRDYKGTLLYGPNILATENDEWKKHKKAAAPAFTEPNNKSVCSATVDIMRDLFENIWRGKNEISVDDVKHLTTDITFLVIARAAFGRDVSWAKDTELPPGHTMTFKESLVTVNSGLFVKVLFPKWSYSFHSKLKHIWNAFEDLPKYLQEIINERKAEGSIGGQSDLLSLLIKASENEKNTAKLTDQEIIADSFVFMVAGHETSSHTLAYALALLVLYPQEQEKLYQHVRSVLSDGRDPTYDDLSKLTYVLAVIYETLRLFPPLPEIPKEAAEDTMLKIRNLDGTERVVPVPKGSRVHVSCVGLHYNPEYWKDPHEFRPERFNENWPRDAFIPFSGGARACIGRRFSETESVVILSMLVMRYEMELLDEPKYTHETFEERKERVLRTTFNITLTPARVPIVFKQRY